MIVSSIVFLFLLVLSGVAVVLVVASLPILLVGLLPLLAAAVASGVAMQPDGATRRPAPTDEITGKESTGAGVGPW